jgi:nitrite reductase/ring-hydroxylating ferredoxin subunit
MRPKTWIPLTRVATYHRTVAASAERVWENVRDWEHLPWLHDSSFSSIECLESGEEGWCARVGLHPSSAGREILLELVIDAAASRYVSRVVEGEGARTEIWTSVEPGGHSQTKIRVEFWLPDVDPVSADALGRVYTELYSRLWDEDEGMMIRRAAELAPRPRSAGKPQRSLALGPLEELRARLPFRVELAGRRFRLVEVDGRLLAHPVRCPHLLGPLEDAAVEAGVVTCPWHGYRFDLRTGLSCDGHGLRLDRAPEVRVDERSQVSLSF